MTDYGIDVSKWTTVRDWAAVRGNDIVFSSVKTTQGDYYVSSTAADQVNGSRGAGIVTGGYHFADPNVPVAGNLAQFVSQSRPLGLFEQGAFLPMLDIEDSPTDHIKWTADLANQFVASYIAGLRGDTGIEPVAVYANLGFWRDVLRPDEWADDGVFLWLALYNGDPGNTGGYTHRRLAIHQHTSQGNVPGVDGFADRNVTVGGFTVQALTIGTVAPPPGPPTPPTPTPSPGGWVDYTVQAGDTLSAIAAAHGTTVAVLAEVNHIPDPNRIYAGQVIRVPAGPAPTTRHYRVQPGDTLTSIAKRFGTTVAAIVAANHIPDPNRIYPGQWLDIP